MTTERSRVRDLMVEAGEAGDYEMVVICLTALDEDDGRFPEVERLTRLEAQGVCARAIRATRAMED